MNNSLTNGFAMLKGGLILVCHRRLRRYIYMPILVNLVVFATVLGYVSTRLDDWSGWLISLLPSWLQWEWLIWLLVPFMLIVVLLLMAMVFTTLANLIASPFNSLLAEQAEALLRNQPLPEQSITAMIKDWPRSMAKEGHKVFYILSRTVLMGLFLLPLAAVLPPVASALGVLLGAWMVALQYMDIPMENRRYSLRQVRGHMARHRLTTFGFGGSVLAMTSVPFVNLLVMPVAVCAATVFWVRTTPELSVDEELTPAQSSVPSHQQS